MGHILDPRRVTGDFQKSTVIAYYQIGRELSETGCYILRKQIKCIDLHANYMVEKKHVTNGWCWDTTTDNVFQKHFNFMKQVTSI